MKQHPTMKITSRYSAPEQTNCSARQEIQRPPKRKVVGFMMTLPVLPLALSLSLLSGGCASRTQEPAKGQSSERQNVASAQSNNKEDSILVTNRALASLIVSMGPPTLITYDANGRLSQNAWDPKESESKYLDKVKTLLEQGADPNALRISGYQPRMGWDSASSTGAAMTFALRGSKGELVASNEGGESLLDFCRKYRLSRTAALLQEHGAK